MDFTIGNVLFTKYSEYLIRAHITMDEYSLVAIFDFEHNQVSFYANLEVHYSIMRTIWRTVLEDLNDNFVFELLNEILFLLGSAEVLTMPVAESQRTDFPAAA